MAKKWISNSLLHANRDISLDYAKGIGILLVVLGHVIQQTNCSSDIKYFTVLIYSFHMPLFFMITGMILYKKDNDTVIEISKEKIKLYKRLLIPYFSWSIIYILAVSLFYLKVSYERIWAVISLKGIAPLWFIITLFFAECIFLWIIKKYNSKTYNCALSFLSIIILIVASSIYNKLKLTLPIEISYPFVFIFRELLAFVFIILGYEFMRWYSKFDFKRNIFIFIISSISFAFIHMHTKYHVSMYTFDFDNITVFFFTSILGSISIISLCYICKNMRLSFLAFNGKKSFDIMVVHYPPFPYIKISSFLCIKAFGDVNVISIFISTLILSYISVYFLNKIKNYLINKNLKIYL